MNYKNSITIKIPQGNDFTLRVELTEYIKLKDKISERKVTFKDGTTPTVNIYYLNGRVIKNLFNIFYEEENHALLISFIELGGTNVLAVGKYAIEIKGKRNEDNSDFRWYLPIGKAFNIVYSSLEGYFPSDSITTYSINGVVGIAQSINGGGGIFLQVLTNWLLEDITAIDYIKNKPNLSLYITSDSLETLFSNKQNTLVSGISIKTINNLSILGSGNLTIAEGSGVTSYNLLTDTPDLTLFLTSSALDDFVTSSNLSDALAIKLNILESGTNIKTINNQSILGTGNISILEQAADNNIITEIFVGEGTSSLPIEISPNKIYKNSNALTSLYIRLIPPVSQDSNIVIGAIYTLRFTTSGNQFKLYLGVKQAQGEGYNTSANIRTQEEIEWKADTEYEVVILFDSRTYSVKAIPLVSINLSGNYAVI